MSVEYNDIVISNRLTGLWKVGYRDKPGSKWVWVTPVGKSVLIHEDDLEIIV